jgi:hypothetical protein
VKTVIHVNQHVIRANAKNGTNDPVLTVKTYKSNVYIHIVYTSKARAVWCIALTSRCHAVRRCGLKQIQKWRWRDVGCTCNIYVDDVRCVHCDCIRCYLDMDVVLNTEWS